MIFLKEVSFLEAAGAVVKMGMSLKLNHHYQVQLSKSVKSSVVHIEVVDFFIVTWK